MPAALARHAACDSAGMDLVAAAGLLLARPDVSQQSASAVRPKSRPETEPDVALRSRMGQSSLADRASQTREQSPLGETAVLTTWVSFPFELESFPVFFFVK